MNKRHEITFKSYDRFFPNQDTMPKGGFGNLIALPLQKTARNNNNSTFINEHFQPIADQWVFLAACSDSFEVYIGGPSGTKTIQEGNYTLQVITRDDNHHFSVPFEKIINIYGNRFRSALTDRVLKKVTYKAADASLSLTFSGATSDKEIGIEIFYTDRNGDAMTVMKANKDLTAAVKLLQVDAGRTVSYRTLFLPEPLAVDTFYTAGKMVVIP
jgi:hypothetical protein